MRRTIDLIKEANNLSKDLKNSSFVRTAVENQPKNLPLEYEILADEGRHGDSSIRKVGGELAHVNTTEANAIDILGPLGEAWVEKVGSGTINPQTGLREYWLKKAIKSLGNRVQHLLSDTDESYNEWVALKERGEVPGTQEYRDLRKERMDNFIREHKDQDWTGTATDPQGNPVNYQEQQLTKDPASGGIGMTEEEYAQYITPWADSDQKRQLDKVTGDYERTAGTEIPGWNEDWAGDGIDNDGDGQVDEFEEQSGRTGGTRGLEADKLALRKDATDLKIGALADKGLNVGNMASGRLFGQLTQSNNETVKKGFAGSGSFAQKFAKGNLMSEIGNQFKGIESSRKGYEIDKADIGIDTEGLLSDYTQDFADFEYDSEGIRDDYNAQFWEQVNRYDTAKSA